MSQTTIKNRTELLKLKTYRERLLYLQTNSKVCEETFGHDRWINQKFYKSDFWKRIRKKVILLDMGCDMGIDGLDIFGQIIIHHINPITAQDIIDRSPFAIDPEYLVCVSDSTHRKIHYGIDKEYEDPNKLIERVPGDTCPWRKNG